VATNLVAIWVYSYGNTLDLLASQGNGIKRKGEGNDEKKRVLILMDYTIELHGG
jgi:hypothetical protein